jgi:uncharacterized protein
MDTPLMPKATAAWLIKNTKLSFGQIADFCNLHNLEVQAIADGEAGNFIGMDPIASGQLTQEEIARCETNESLSLKLASKGGKTKTKGKKYIPIANRQDKPDSILWLLKHEAELTDKEVSKLTGAAVSTVISIRNKTYWNYDNLKPRNPATINICSQADLDKILEAAERRKLAGETVAKPK